MEAGYRQTAKLFFRNPQNLMAMFEKQVIGFINGSASLQGEQDYGIPFIPRIQFPVFGQLQQSLRLFVRKAQTKGYGNRFFQLLS